MTILQKHDPKGTLDLHNPDGSHVDLGQWKIDEDGAGTTLPFTLRYMGPADSPGYGVWEPVKSFPTREAAEGFRDNPPAWWAQGGTRTVRMGLHLSEHTEVEDARKAAGVCTFVNWGVGCTLPPGHDGDHDPGPDAFPSVP